MPMSEDGLKTMLPVVLILSPVVPKSMVSATSVIVPSPVAIALSAVSNVPVPTSMFTAVFVVPIASVADKLVFSLSSVNPPGAVMAPKAVMALFVVLSSVNSEPAPTNVAVNVPAVTPAVSVCVISPPVLTPRDSVPAPTLDDDAKL